MRVATVGQLSIYPIKSAAGIQLNEMQLGPLGPNNDRRWMIVDAQGRFITQRKVPAMCQVGTSLQDDSLHLSAPNMDDLVVSGTNGELVSSEVWGYEVQGLDCGDEAGEWFAQHLGRPARLIYMPDDYQRLVNPERAKNGERVAFADGYPVLFLSQHSMQPLSEKLGFTADINRFRANIVLRDCDAHAEDQWKRVEISGIEFSLDNPCARCVVPSTDQSSGERSSKVLDALNSYRRVNREIYFGQNGIYHSLGTIRVGDSVNLIAGEG